MRFTNTKDIELSFSLGGHRYVVPAGGTVDLPDKFTAAVKSRGLPLEPIPGTEGSVPEPRHDGDAAPPPGTQARLWYDRAHQVKAALMSLQEQHAAVLNESSDDGAEMQAKIDGLDASLAEAGAFLTRLRERLGIGAEDSIVDAIDALKADLAKALDAATKPGPKARGGTGGG